VMAVLTRPVDAGVLVALSGTLDNEQQLDALTHGLACLTADGVLIVDVSGVLLGASRLFARLVDNLGDQIATAMSASSRPGQPPVSSSVVAGSDPCQSRPLVRSRR